jgi:hypothetical protein
MKGHIPAALDVEQIDAQRAVLLLRLEQVVVPTPVTQGNDRSVLEDKHGVGNTVSLTGLQ